MPDTQEEKLQKVVTALETVNPETQKMIFEMARSMGELEIIQTFNQHTLDLFTLITNTVQIMGKEKDVKFGGYKLLLENALKINVKSAS